jgi:hypothetical protein
MNDTSEWICKLYTLKDFSRAEQADQRLTVAELDRVDVERGPEYEALQYDLKKLVRCY